MPSLQTFILRGFKLSSSLATLALAGIGGLISKALGLPLGMLLGALVTVAVLATLRVQIFGRLPGIPQNWRMLVIPCLGVAIGGSVPSDLGAQIAQWWPALVASALFVPIAHAASYVLYQKGAGLDGATAFFAAMPGGYIEALEMGEARGADMQMLLMLQFLRLILCIVCIPLAFGAVSGHAVGSAAGVALPGSDLPMGLVDFAILLGCAVFGYFGAKAIRFPAPILVGPLALSGLVHALGIVEVSPPGWVLTMAQWIIGASLGSRFAGLQLGRLWLAMRLSVVSLAISLSIAGGFALLLAAQTGQPLASLILAYAPGGVSEMALVAISLQLSAIFVTLNHLVRIICAVIVARIGLKFIDPRPQA